MVPRRGVYISFHSPWDRDQSYGELCGLRGWVVWEPTSQYHFIYSLFRVGPCDHWEGVASSRCYRKSQLLLVS